MKKILLFAATWLYPAFCTFAQRQVAITIDDPNTIQTPVYTWQERNENILRTLERFHIQAAIFVCGMRVNDNNGISLLKEWDQAGHMICNHSYSHLYYPSSKVSSDQFIQDFKKGDSSINNFSNYTKLFRFPYLKEGASAEKRDAMRAVLNSWGYKNGHVTIDASDWYIDTKVKEALAEDSNADLSVYRDFYIWHILDRTEYYDSLAQLTFHRDIKHTLLIHHSLLNALFLDDLLRALQQRGWQLIDAKEAFRDPVFALLPMIEPCGESIVWQQAALDTTLSKTLRYPAEDSRYEEATLQKAIDQKSKAR